LKSLPWLSACVLAGSLAGGPSQAQQPGLSQNAPAALHADAIPSGVASRVTLRAAFDAAWARAVAARQAEGQRRLAEADRAVAGSLWAAPPALELGHRDDRLHSSLGSRETEIGVALALWLPGQRAARGATAEAAVAHAQAAEQAARLHLAVELREAAWHLAALGAEAAQAASVEQSLQSLADDVDRRVRAGDLAPADALAARAERLAAAARHAEVRQRLQAAHARWTLLTGMQATPEMPIDALQAEPDAATASPTAHPELTLARLSTALARQRVELLQRSRREAPELMVSLRQDVPGRAAASKGSLAVGLRLPFATADRNRPLEAAAISELELAQILEERERERLDSELLTARAALHAAREQLLAERTRAQLLRDRAALIDQSFRAGETALPDLLRALADASQADSAVARQTAALGLVHARLETTLGRLP
jgi:outer membrane protein, heavy metal efflux system